MLQPWTSPPTNRSRGAGWRPSGRDARHRSTRSARPAESRTRTASTAPTASPTSAPSGRDLEAGAETTEEVSVAGRVMLKRDTGKLVFATIAERGAEVQLFISKAVIGDEGFAAVKELDRGDWVGVHGTVMTTPRRRAVGEGRPCRVARQVAAPAARQVARPRRSGHPVPPALRRPHRQRRRQARLRGAPRGHRQLPAHAPRARLRRGRDTGAARRCGRCPRPPVRHPLQRAGHAAVPADRPRAAPQAADRRRHGPRVRDRPGVPQRGPLQPAQHRVHDDGVLRGVRRRDRCDGADRGARRAGGARRARHDGRADPRRSPSTSAPDCRSGG